MPHDPIMRWENEGGTVLLADRVRRDRPPADEARADKRSCAPKAAARTGKRSVTAARRVTKRNGSS